MSKLKLFEQDPNHIQTSLAGFNFLHTLGLIIKILMDLLLRAMQCNYGTDLML